MTEWMQRRLRSDAGIGMILVIGISVFVAGLTATAGVVVMNGLAQSKHRIGFEQSLAAAESGIDFALGHVQYAYDHGPKDYPVPKSGVAPKAGCSIGEVTMPDLAAEADPAAAERAWVKNWFDTKLATAQGQACMIDTPTGQVMVLKPKNAPGETLQYGRVFARGYSPSLAAANGQNRTIKVEYVMMPYKPSHAILTGTKLKLQSTSTDVMGVDAEASKLAAVHTNGTLEVTGNPKVTGEVSVGVASDAATSSNFTLNPGGLPIVRPVIPIPHISARTFYSQADDQDETAALTGPTGWTDLCDTGEAKAYNPAGEPCEGDVIGYSPYQGWSYDASAHTWTASKTTLSGTYFVHKANVANAKGGGNVSIPNITVIASGTTDGCDKQYGNIVWDHLDTPAPAFTGLFFLADGDLQATANFYSGQSGSGKTTVSGMYVAGEEVYVWTSSSGLVGSVLAANQCPNNVGPVDANEVQGQIIKFDPDGSSPFSSLIATTLWLEY